MKIRKINLEIDLLAFQKSYQDTYQLKSEKTGVEIPLEYLQRNLVYGVFDSKKNMLAGYVLGVTLPLRLVDCVPFSSRNSMVVPFQGDWSDCCEITCVWRKPSVSPLYMSAVFWPQALMKMLISGKRILLGHNQSERLDKFYTTLGPKTIYSGISSYGLQSRLFAYSRLKVLWSIVLFLIFETPRRLLKWTFRLPKTAKS